MKNIKVLDCTLRDGGRIIDCAFSNDEIREISYKLANAKIDIIEVGFLRDWRKVSYQGNSTFFTDVNQMQPFVDKSKKNTMYVAFVDYGMFDFETLKPYDGSSIDGLRVGFTKNDFVSDLSGLKHCLKIVKRCGYKLFIQGVNSLGYTDREILEIIDIVNELEPQGFGLVDTYGAMYIDDVDRLYNLVDHNMRRDIWIDFHSHNNFQLSFAFAQEIIKLSRGTRTVVIDTTLNGMGKGAGNLNTELIVDYLVRKMDYDYEFDNILDIIDQNIYKYKQKDIWGYSIPTMMAGVYKSHPNNVIYLLQKFRMDTKDIKNIMSMIDEDVRQRYDYDNIERLYVEYCADKIDDYEALEKIKSIIGGKEVLIIAPGNTLNTYCDMINKYIIENKPIVISVNFVTDVENSYSFFGNAKRYNMLKDQKKKQEILTSNIRNHGTDSIIVNYHSLINRGYKYFDNSMIMLMNLLKKIEVTKITIAGFDGFKMNENNYTDNSFQNERHVNEFDDLNKELYDMFSEIYAKIKEHCVVKMITPSIFDQVLNDLSES